MAEDEKADVGATNQESETKPRTHARVARKTDVKTKRVTKRRPGKRKEKTAAMEMGGAAATRKEEAAKDASKGEGDSSVGFSFPLEKALAILLVIAILFIGYLLVNNLNGGQAPAQTTRSGITETTLASSAGGGEKAKLEFFVMSKCPYGTQVLDAIAPVLKKMEAYVDFRVNYIADDSGNGQFSSLHGQTEVDEDIRELCAAKYYPYSYKFMDYITCRDANIQSTAWESCTSINGIDTAKIKACSTGDEGAQLLKVSIIASQKAGASGSPTIILNGQPYNSGRQEADFTRAICNALSSKPAVCNNLPQPVKFDLTILNDQRCKTCDTAMIESRLKSMFPQANIINVDYSTAEGKKIYDDTKAGLLPAILFPDSVNKDPSYSQIQRYLVRLGPCGA